VFSEFPVPTVGSLPAGITAGPDGALWFTESNKIGRVTTGGVFSEFPVSTEAGEPNNIAAGPGGKVWFTDHVGNKIGRLSGVGVVGPREARPQGSTGATGAGHRK
jgi:virginiamycin B lyase